MKQAILLAMILLSVLMSQAQAAPKAVTDYATIIQPDSVSLSVLANDSNFNVGDTICISAIFGADSGWATIRGCSRITYRPLDKQFYGVDSFYYISCDTRFPVSLCDTGKVVITVLRKPKPVRDRAFVFQKDTLLLNVLANDTNFQLPDTLCITSIINVPGFHLGWESVRDCDHIFYKPLDTTYYGLDSFYYRSCDTRIPTLCDTGKVIINIILTPIAVYDTAVLIQPDTAIVNVIANDTAFNLIDSLCITSVWGVPDSSVSILNCNQIAYHPSDFHHTGNDTIYYQTCYSQIPTVCDTSELIVTVVLNPPLADFIYSEAPGCQVTVDNISELYDNVNWTVHFLTGNGVDTTYGNVNEFDLTAYGDSAFQAEVCITATNPSGPSTSCYTFWIECSGSNGIEDINASDIRIYPNPASDEVQMDLSHLDADIRGNLSSVTLYDMTGRLLRTTALKSNTILHVGDLSTGLYLIGMTDRRGMTKIVSKIEVIR